MLEMFRKSNPEETTEMVQAGEAERIHEIRAEQANQNFDKLAARAISIYLKENIGDEALLLQYLTESRKAILRDTLGRFERNVVPKDQDVDQVLTEEIHLSLSRPDGASSIRTVGKILEQNNDTRLARLTENFDEISRRASLRMQDKYQINPENDFFPLMKYNRKLMMLKAIFRSEKDTENPDRKIGPHDFLDYEDLALMNEMIKFYEYETKR